MRDVNVPRCRFKQSARDQSLNQTIGAADSSLVSRQSRNNDGFTLVEILIAIVLVGVLSAVVVLGISKLTGKASSASCSASADAARTASLASYTQRLTYPTSFADLTQSSGANPPLLVLPSGGTAVGRTVATKDWTLTMSSSAPPTFTCAPASADLASPNPATATPTPAAPTTATPATATPVTPAPKSNGVTVVASTNGDARYYGANILTLTNKAEITEMIITISVVQDAGLKYNDQYNTAWSERIDQSSMSSKTLDYTFELRRGTTIIEGTWLFVGSWNLTNGMHDMKGDTWTVTTTSSGITSTLTGTF